MQQLQIPPLADGELYVGAIGDKNGDVHHVILLPGDNDDATWQDQMDWAKRIGGDLPDRIEQSMLFANFRDQFKKDWYWSNTTVVGYDAYAWCQFFLNGTQYDGYKDTNDCRARAVRRLAI
jgi:hypothetical protein